MQDSLYVAATGMFGQQLNVEAIANNLANVSTSGYKKSRVAFQELYYREADRAAAAQDPNAVASAINPYGTGVAIGNVDRVFTDGELKKSDSPLDFAITGAGLIEVTLPDGSTAYTRVASLQINADRMLVTSDGNLLHPPVQLPDNATDLQIDSAGIITIATTTGGAREEIGQLDLTSFPNPAGLKPLGNNLFVATDRSGQGITGKPGVDGMGTISQGYLEASNVKLIDELTSLMIAQRAYEANSKVVQASDDMMAISNNLRR